MKRVLWTLGVFLCKLGRSQKRKPTVMNLKNPLLLLAAGVLVGYMAQKYIARVPGLNRLPVLG